MQDQTIKNMKIPDQWFLSKCHIDQMTFILMAKKQVFAQGFANFEFLWLSSALEACQSEKVCILYNFP